MTTHEIITAARPTPELEGYSGLIEFPGPRKFAITMEGFVNLVRFDYIQRCAWSYTFRDAISFNMYLYAMMIHLYGRLIALRLVWNSMTEDDMNLLCYLKAKPRRMSRAIQEYFSNIGSFQDDNGRHFCITFPIWPNKNGDFEKVSATTHWKYMSFLSPRIVAYAITRDLAYTNGEGRQLWNIPFDLQPDSMSDCRPGLPTANFLGWSPAFFLTKKQQDMLNKFITPSNFNATGPFYLNENLFEYIDKKLRYVCPRTVHVLQHTLGSKGQIAFCEKEKVQSDKDVEYNTQRIAHYTDRKTRLVSCSWLDPYTSAHIHLYQYRVRKEILQIPQSNDHPCAEYKHTWAIYDWNNYNNVPDCWINTRNTIYNYGDMEFYNYNEFYTRFYDKDYLSYLIWSRIVGRSYSEEDTSEDAAFLARDFARLCR
ncbi:uncharacterized protein LOC143264471 [Megachile rotundata]|uniref:uncharacterized protein LOC143264471 n=1 Tax=Megachile rotundata TaxID=143995 RepID=UPI003FCF7FA2